MRENGDEPAGLDGALAIAPNLFSKWLESEFVSSEIEFLAENSIATGPDGRKYSPTLKSISAAPMPKITPPIICERAVQ